MTGETRHTPHVCVGADAVAALVDYLAEQGLRRAPVVADENTYAALGERVARGLRSAGLEVAAAVVEGPSPS